MDKPRAKKKKINTPLLSVSSPITVYAGALDDRKEACSFPITETRTLHQQLLKKKKRKEKTKKKTTKEGSKSHIHAPLPLSCCHRQTQFGPRECASMLACKNLYAYMRTCGSTSWRTTVHSSDSKSNYITQNKREAKRKKKSRGVTLLARVSKLQQIVPHIGFLIFFFFVQLIYEEVLYCQNTHKYKKKEKKKTNTMKVNV